MENNDIITIKQALAQLGEDELKSYLSFILLQIGQMKEKEVATKADISELIHLYDELLELRSRRMSWEPVPNCTHVHIVVGDSFAGSLKQALKELGLSRPLEEPHSHAETRNTEIHKMIILRENYAIGPLRGLDSPEGREVRSRWFREHITDGYEAHVEEDYQALLDKLGQIPEQAEVIIWTSDNVCEQAGLRYAIHLLSGKANSITVCDACAAADRIFRRPDHFMHYRHSGEIPTEKLRELIIHPEEKAQLSTDDIQRLQQEWQSLTEPKSKPELESESAQIGTLRIWQDNSIVEVPADYYDQYLLDTLDKLRTPASARNAEFLKSARLIGEVIGYCDQYIGDSYLEYRLRELIYSGILEIQGIPAGMRFFSVRRKYRSHAKNTPQNG